MAATPAFAIRMIAAALLLLFATHALATPARPFRPPRVIDPTALGHLVDAIKAETFTDGKIGRLREVAGGRAYLFTGSQTLTLLPLFTYWTDRVEALRLLSLADPQEAPRVLRYFDPAPELLRSEARTILTAPR
jgi:hypothetical protein